MLLSKIISDSKIKHSNLIRSFDKINMDDLTKAQHIANIVINSYILNESIIDIDDLESVINYSQLNNYVVFSNKMYQTITTLLRTQSLDKKHKLTLLITCGDYNLSLQIEKNFDLVLEIDI